MSDDRKTELPEMPRIHGFVAPGASTPTLLGVPGQYMSRATALATLKQTFAKGVPRELAHVSHVELVALDDDDRPVSLGPVRIQTPLSELVLGAHGGTRTVTVPRSRL